MDIKIEKQPKSVVKFQIKATSDEVAKFFNRAIEKLSQDLKMPGFRPGRVPHKIAEDVIGKQAIENQAKELAVNDFYFEMVNQNKLIPLARPFDVKVNLFSQDKGLDWEGKVEVLPEVELGDWKEKLKNQKSKFKINGAEVSNQEIENVLLNLRKRSAQLEEKKGLSEKGDWINIDIDIADKENLGYDKAKKFQSKNFGLVIGEANFIPGFEDELVSLEKESEKEFDITFPSNYIDKEIANKKVKFRIKVNDVRKVVLPKLDNRFAKEFNKDTIEDLKKAIKEDIMQQKEQREKLALENKILEEIIKHIKIEIPNILIEQEKDMMLERFKHDLEYHKGIKFVDYLASLGKGEQEVREGFTEQAEKNVKMGLVLGKITKEEKIKVDDRDIEQAMSMDIIRQTAGLPPKKAKETEDQIKERYKDEQFINSIKNSILARKTINKIIDMVKEK